MQTVLLELGAANESLTDISGNHTVQKPQWTALGAFEALIENEKSLAGNIPRTLYSNHDRAWNRAKQSPSNKNAFPRRMPVRQVPFIVSHFAVATFLRFTQKWGFFLSIA